MTNTDPTASPNRPWLTNDIAWVRSGADIAAYLRAAADAFDTVGDLPQASVNLGVQVSAHAGTVPSAERTAAVDILSAALGLTARPRKLSSGGDWHYGPEYGTSAIRPFTAIDTPTCRFLGGGCANEQAGEGDEGLCAEHIAAIWPQGRPADSEDIVDGEVVGTVPALTASVVVAEPTDEPKADPWAQFLTVACPACGAAVGELCKGRSAQWSHINRRNLSAGPLVEVGA